MDWNTLPNRFDETLEKTILCSPGIHVCISSHSGHDSLTKLNYRKPVFIICSNCLSCALVATVCDYVIYHYYITCLINIPKTLPEFCIYACVTGLFNHRHSMLPSQGVNSSSLPHCWGVVIMNWWVEHCQNTKHVQCPRFIRITCLLILYLNLTHKFHVFLSVCLSLWSLHILLRRFTKLWNFWVSKTE